MEKHDVWQWFCIITLKFWENISDALAITLVLLNIVWVGVRLWDWFSKKMDET